MIRFYTFLGLGLLVSFFVLVILEKHYKKRLFIFHILEWIWDSFFVLFSGLTIVLAIISMKPFLLFLAVIEICFFCFYYLRRTSGNKSIRDIYLLILFIFILLFFFGKVYSANSYTQSRIVTENGFITEYKEVKIIHNLFGEGREKVVFDSNKGK